MRLESGSLNVETLPGNRVGWKRLLGKKVGWKRLLGKVVGLKRHLRNGMVLGIEGWKSLVCKSLVS
jgi:hypothetical protein